jgi:hypothetical protein
MINLLKKNWFVELSVKYNKQFHSKLSSLGQNHLSQWLLNILQNQVCRWKKIKIFLTLNLQME